MHAACLAEPCGEPDDLCEDGFFFVAKHILILWPLGWGGGGVMVPQAELELVRVKPLLCKLAPH